MEEYPEDLNCQEQDDPTVEEEQNLKEREDEALRAAQEMENAEEEDDDDGPSKICGSQSLKKLNGFGLL